jgi:hypothetical protein
VVRREKALVEMKHRAVRLFQRDADRHGGFGGERAAGQRGRAETRFQRRRQQRLPEQKRIGAHKRIEPLLPAGRKNHRFVQ